MFGDAAHPIFSRIEHLRIAGCMLLPAEAQAIAGRNGALPSLRSVTWTMWQRTESPSSVLNLICTLLGIDRNLPADSEHAAQDSDARFPATPHSADGEHAVQQHLRRGGLASLNVHVAQADYDWLVALAPEYVRADTRLSLGPTKKWSDPQRAVYAQWTSSVDAMFEHKLAD